VFTSRNIPSVIVEMPQQQNYHDCGVFLLQCFESFFNRPIQSFSIPFRSLSHWFYEDDIKGKREEIFQSILQILKDQYPDRVHLLPLNFLDSVETEATQSINSPDLFDCYSNEKEQFVSNNASNNHSEFEDSSSLSSSSERNQSSISPTPPLPIYKLPSNTDPYAADDSCSNDSDDYYVPLLTPERAEPTSYEFIDLDDEDNQEVRLNGISWDL